MIEEMPQCACDVAVARYAQILPPAFVANVESAVLERDGPRTRADHPVRSSQSDRQ
ncbi:hypothetical protein [Micromonospora sp. NPDC093277]|uniref:hypothetical protein n=1 Tax=Micromonospora sp. NPDC093277 TaxID=3364291 RepID=UPI0038077166